MVKFSELALNDRTQQALKKENFIEMTEIQDVAIPLALEGKDILAAAKTGSGKSLAFLIPVLEILCRENWTQHDGLGALIITPTRELALQLFEVLRKIGYKHTFSAGLVIGGKSLEEEKEKIIRMSILIATPGRLLQHLDQTPGFQTQNLKVLVLDEADKILEMGFSNTLNAIIESLPKERQTLLFSATQTSSVKDLARLNLKKTVKVDINDGTAECGMPNGLLQYYMKCPIEMKYDWIYSFVKTHVSNKIIIFMSSCKQVRFYFETFCKLQPGLPVLSLHGMQSQPKRFAVFKDFCKKPAAVLFCTDVAARGLDFPAIDWVIQMDCPDSIETYIHRVGRTARNQKTGNGLLFLLPSEEEGMLELFQKKNVPIHPMEPNASKITSMQGKLASLCSQFPEIKYLGQKAVICYVRSIFLHPVKTIFNINAIDCDAYAHSLGLPSTPLLRFVKKVDLKNVSRDLTCQQPDQDENDIDSSISGSPIISTSKAITKKSLRLPKSKPSAVAFGTSSSDLDDFEEDSKLNAVASSTSRRLESLLESDDDILRKKSDARHLQADFDNVHPLSVKPLSKKKLKKLVSKGAITAEEHYIFAEDGSAQPAYAFQTEQSIIDQATSTVSSSDKRSRPRMMDLAVNHQISTREQIQNADLTDKQVAKDKRKAQRALLKEKERKRKSKSDSSHIFQAGFELPDEEEDEESASISYPIANPPFRHQYTYPLSTDSDHLTEELALKLLAS